MPGVLCQAGTWTKVQKPLGYWQQDAVPCLSLEWALLLVLGTRAAAGEGSSSVSARPVPNLHQLGTMTMTMVEIKR